MNNNEEMEKLSEWNPKTELGRKVKSGEINNLNYILENNMRILEPEIVDYLLPDLQEDFILIGGTPGKGGGKKRIVAKKTARMHKSGRRFKSIVMVLVGNKNGFLGLGESGAKDVKDAIIKAEKKAKMNIFRVVRGCGSWECGCKGNHSIPFKVIGKSGSSIVELIPAPKGVGLVANDEVKKVLELAGIKDLWMRSPKKVNTRENMVKAVINALKNLHRIKYLHEIGEEVGIVKGVA